MLPPKNRLRKNKDFETVFRKGRGVSVGPVFLKFLGNGLDVSRVGISVGVKFSAKATERALIKRRLREIFHQYAVSLVPGFDIIIALQRNLNPDDLSLMKLDVSIRTALERSKLIIKNKK